MNGEIGMVFQRFGREGDLVEEDHRPLEVLECVARDQFPVFRRPAGREIVGHGGGNRPGVFYVMHAQPFSPGGRIARPMTDDPFGLAKRVVLITGGTRGIGRSCVEAFAAAGADVALTSRTQQNAQDVATDVQKKYGVRVGGFACDVSQEPSVEAMVRRLAAWSRRPLAAVVNNAGHELVSEWWSTPLHKLEPRELLKAVRTVAGVDLDGARWVTYHTLPRMLKQGAGNFVYVSSTPAITGYQGFPYTEAKAAILGLMRDVARVYGPKGIRANAVAPGNIRTEWLDQVSARSRRKLEKENPLHRFGEPEEVANTILFLASHLSSFVTGETIIVDGGTVIR